jgi:hypothetical protein
LTFREVLEEEESVSVIPEVLIHTSNVRGDDSVSWLLEGNVVA